MQLVSNYGVGYFETKIYHPNVSNKGEICVNTLKKDWNPKDWNIAYIFKVRDLHLTPKYRLLDVY